MDNKFFCKFVDNSLCIFCRVVMVYDIKTLAGIVEMTQRWHELRESFYLWVLSNSNDSRWQDGVFAAHMKSNYIDVDVPLSARLYELDQKNQETVIRFINEYLMDGMASRFVDV